MSGVNTSEEEKQRQKKREGEREREKELHPLCPALISLMGCWPRSRWDVSPGATGQEEADEAGLLGASGATQTKHTPRRPPYCTVFTAFLK